MTTGTLDEICPDYIGEDRVRVSIVTLVPTAFNIVEVAFDYSACAPVGMSLPIEIVVTEPSNRMVRKILRRTLPNTFSFAPRSGGTHQVRIAEVGHNKWWGSLLIDVLGDKQTRGIV